MNNFPRIKELKIQACKWASENASSAEYENAADQKFAELIVRECMDQVEQAKNSPFVRLDDAKRMAHFVDVTKKKIQKHFGV